MTDVLKVFAGWAAFAGLWSVCSGPVSFVAWLLIIVAILALTARLSA